MMTDGNPRTGEVIPEVEASGGSVLPEGEDRPDAPETHDETCPAPVDTASSEPPDEEDAAEAKDARSSTGGGSPNLLVWDEPPPIPNFGPKATARPAPRAASIPLPMPRPARPAAIDEIMERMPEETETTESAPPKASVQSDAEIESPCTTFPEPTPCNTTCTPEPTTCTRETPSRPEPHRDIRPADASANTGIVDEASAPSPSVISGEASTIVEDWADGTEPVEDVSPVSFAPQAVAHKPIPLDDLIEVDPSSAPTPPLPPEAIDETEASGDASDGPGVSGDEGEAVAEAQAVAAEGAAEVPGRRRRRRRRGRRGGARATATSTEEEPTAEAGTKADAEPTEETEPKEEAAPREEGAPRRGGRRREREREPEPEPEEVDTAPWKGLEHGPLDEVLRNVERAARERDRGAILFLERIAERKDRGLRLAAARALGEIGHMRGLAPLVRYLEDGDEELVREAARSIGLLLYLRDKEYFSTDNLAFLVLNYLR